MLQRPTKFPRRVAYTYSEVVSGPVGYTNFRFRGALDRSCETVASGAAQDPRV